MEYELYDMHSHILPGIDDGCKTPEESVEAMRRSFAQGVRGMFATSHYYPVEAVDEFLFRRSQAADRLWHALIKEDASVLPAVCLGAEVAFRPGICFEEKLNDLCLGNSHYLLLELPFQKWNNEVVRGVHNICSSRGITPVLAHIERYIGKQPKELVEAVLEENVLVQMNADNFCGFRDSMQARKLMKNRVVQLLGSDCHNLTVRAPNLEKAVEGLCKYHMEDILLEECNLAKEIFYEGMGWKQS